MTWWQIDTVGVAHERYHVEAETEEQARATFTNGEVTRTSVSEVDDVEIVRVVETT